MTPLGTSSVHGVVPALLPPSHDASTEAPAGSDSTLMVASLEFASALAALSAFALSVAALLLRTGRSAVSSRSAK